MIEWLFLVIGLLIVVGAVLWICQTFIIAILPAPIQAAVRALVGIIGILVIIVVLIWGKLPIHCP
jgi:hypothetical protein